jgi:hypothetical protein
VNIEIGRIAVDFDPDVLRASMDLWRKATDMEIPLADQFKIHLMERRRALLEGFVKTGAAWTMILRDMKATDGADELERLREDVRSFDKWAEGGLKSLDALAADDRTAQQGQAPKILPAPALELCRGRRSGGALTLQLTGLH